MRARLIALLSIFLGVLASVSAQTKKQNVVFFLVDDLGWRDIEPLGSTFYETPNLKALAADGLLFTNAYAACPVCSPTRASIMTGKYPARLHETDWFGAVQPEAVIKDSLERAKKPMLPAAYEANLPLSEKTIAEAFKANGYATFFAGKWHLGQSEAFWPEHQGFDVNKGGFSKGTPPSYFSPYKNPRLSDGPVGEHLPDRLANEANLFIEANKERPFFAYFSFYSVHVPLVPREDLRLKYEQKRAVLGLSDQFGTEGNNQVRQVQSNTSYAAMVEAMDMAVGKVIHQLKVLGLYDNTIIVFFSDNGGLSTAEGLPTSNLPLRAGKGWLYEGGTREPLIVKWSGIAHPGSATDVPVISTDFYPSLLEMAQLSPAPKQALDAKSFVPILKGQSFKQRPLFWHYPHYGNQGGTPGSAIRNGDWKLIRWYEDKPRTELFNLKVDLGEQHNVIAQYPALAKKLNQQLDKWLVEQNAVLPQKNPYFKK